MEEPLDLLTFEENIQIDDEARVHFKDIIKWGKFLSVTLLILLFIFAVILFIAKDDPDAFRTTRVTPYTLIMWSCMLISAVALSILLYRFSAICDRALANDDISDLNRGLQALKVFFIINALLGIIICFFTAIALI